MWLLGDLSSAQSKLDWSGGQGPPRAEPTPGGEGWPLGCLFKPGCPKSSPLSPLQSRSSNSPPPHPVHQTGCPECLATAYPASRGESYAPSHISSFLMPDPRFTLLTMSSSTPPNPPPSGLKPASFSAAALGPFSLSHLHPYTHPSGQSPVTSGSPNHMDTLGPHLSWHFRIWGP